MSYVGGRELSNGSARSELRVLPPVDWLVSFVEVGGVVRIGFGSDEPEAGLRDDGCGCVVPCEETYESGTYWV